MTRPLDVERIRREFPALSRMVAGRPAVFLDGPAGSQVPVTVADAVRDYLLERNANSGGHFATSRETAQVLSDGHRAAADLLGCRDPDEVAFGPNMTTLAFGLARALSRTLGPDDEVIVSRLEHDANFTPWVQAARDAGATVREAPIRTEDCTLDLDALQSLLGSRTRLVAITAASNAVGSLTPVRRVCDMAHAVGAEVFVDAVHYAPHRSLDVEALGCDYLACSPYKFFGPHMGLLWGRREPMERAPAYKLRPPSDAIPHRWMTGTPCHEGIAGTTAAIDYLAGLAGKDAGDRRASLLTAFTMIRAHETGLVARLLRGLAAMPAIAVHGIADPDRVDERVPTVAFTHETRTPAEIARYLGDRGIFVWDGNYYALPLTEALGVEPGGMVRVGFLHYNTEDEVDRLLDALDELER